MTRINSAIPVRCLTDEHLLAEHREIKRLPYNLNQAIRKGSIDRIPERFVLGKGHVLFFLDKMLFVYDRYCKIHDELIRRGYAPTSFHENWNTVPLEYYNKHMPTEEECRLLIDRIKERIVGSPKKVWHYYCHEVSKEGAIDILNNF